MAGGDPDRPLLPPRGSSCRRRSSSCERRILRASTSSPPVTRKKRTRAPLFSTPLPAVAVDRRANDPLAGLKAFSQLGAARDGRGRVAWPARDHGELLRRVRPEARLVHGIRGVPEGDVLFPALRLAAAHGFTVPAEGWAVVTEAELYAGVVRPGARGRELPVKACSATCRSSRWATRWCTSSMASDASRVDDLERGRGAGRVPPARVRGRRQALRPGRAARRHRPLQRRPARRSPAAQARQRPMGQGEGTRGEAGARHRSRAARAVREARARLGHAFSIEQRDLGRFPRASASRRRPTRPRRSSRS